MKHYDWDDIVWSDEKRRYLWADGTETRVVRGVQLDANDAVKQLRMTA